ncbi:MAG: PAS domain S-box protein, partial [Candidatus Hodarchaeales archaeon]
LDTQGNIVLINKKGCEVLGYDNEAELLGKNWIDTCREEKDREWVKRGYQALMTGELDLVTDYEDTIITKDGKKRLISWHHSLLTDETGAISGILSSGTDITEKKAKEEENIRLLHQLEQTNRELAKANQDLRESQELFAQFMDHLPAAAFIKDSDGKTLFANQYLKDVFGGEAWIGKTTAELFPTEIAQHMIAADQKALNEGLQIITEELLDKYNAAKTHQTYKFPIKQSNAANLLGGIAIDITDQKDAERMLKESQQLMKGVFNGLLDAIFIIDADTVKTLDCNRAASEIFSYSRQEMLNRTIDFLHVDEAALERFREQLYPAIEEKGFLHLSEFSMKRKDGIIFPSEHNVIPLEDENGKRIAWVSVVRDIADRKRAEAALQESEETLRKIIDAIPVGISITSPEGGIIEANSAAWKINGYDSKEDFLQIDATALWHDPTEREQYIELLKRGVVRDFEAQFKKKDGTVFWGSATSIMQIMKNRPQLINTFQDITKRKQAEKALRESEERFRDLVENIKDVVYILDSKGNLTYASPSIEALLGYAPSEIMGRPIDNSLHPEDKQRALEGMQAVLSGSSEPGEYRLISKSGDVHWVQTSSKPIFSEDNVIGLQGVMRDITERKQAERALRESEGRFRVLAEQTIIGITIIQKSRLIFANDAIAKISGYSIKELLAWNSEGFLKVVHPDDREIVLSQARKKQSGDPDVVPQYDVRIITKSGEIRWIANYSLHIELASGPALLGTYVDITDRKQAEKALRESEEKWRSLAANAPNIIMIVDSDGTIQFINRTTSEVALEQIIGKKIYEYLDPEYHHIARNAIEHVFQTAEPTQYESLVHVAGGDIRWYITHVGPIKQEAQVASITQIATDITDRKQAEEALRESEEKFYKMFNEANDLMVLLDEEGNVVELNQKGCQLANLERDQLVGKNLAELDVVLPQDIPIVTEKLRRIFKGERATMDLQLRNTEGHLIDLEVTGSLITLKEETGVLVIGRDVTERNIAEAQLLRQKEELSEFAHAMSHDLKNSLLSIEGYAEVLEAEYDESYVEKIRQLAVSMNKLLRRSVALADAGQIVAETEELNLTRLAQIVAENIVPNDILCVVDNFPTVRADHEKMAQVFQNLFENAVIHGAPKRIEVRSQIEKEGISLQIHNDGAQIPAEHRSKVFAKGFTTIKEDGGLGLGLAIVKKIVEAHGWTIRLADTPATTFIIQIPNKS